MTGIKRNKSNDDDGDVVQAVYGDLITFVMMLFVLLFVLSYNKNKTQDFVTEMQVKFGERMEEQQVSMTTDALLISRIEHFIDKNKLKDNAEIVVDEHRVKLILNPPLLFDSGKANLKKGSGALLKSLSETFKEVFNPIVIEGHTDNVPINNKDFRSNWELSFHRAYSVVRYLIYTKKYTPERLSGIGYGEYHPIKNNDTKENRAQNRRIEVNVIRISESDGV
ncbi:hypothetical protein DID75_05525 [Candidatus Marinamargulisbacteria bacterium SCGC AG-410-N11]|nr:hypothetical protein DID75_05525 [Candidatus Marinamargulisbacteria bacterium SCGC AG-410-N11]